jgi:hypothetical protein
MSVHSTPESSKTKKELDKLNEADLVAKLMQVQEDAGEAAGPHAGASGGAAGEPLAMQQVLISLMKQQQEDSRRRDAQEVARLQDMKDERCQHEAEQERREEQEANRRKEEQERFDRLLATLQPGLQQPPQQPQVGSGGGNVAPQAAAQGHMARPTAKAPPTLDKDMDFKKFVQWRKTWTNYTTVIKLPDEGAADRNFQELL